MTERDWRRREARKERKERAGKRQKKQKTGERNERETPNTPASLSLYPRICPMFSLFVSANDTISSSTLIFIIYLLETLSFAQTDLQVQINNSGRLIWSVRSMETTVRTTAFPARGTKWPDTLLVDETLLGNVRRPLFPALSFLSFFGRLFFLPLSLSPCKTISALSPLLPFPLVKYLHP